MRRYSDTEERRIRTRAHVRAWTRSGLLSAPQAAQLETELRVDLRRTNLFLRITLALFTALIVGGVVGFVLVTSGVTRAMPVAILTGVAAMVCFALAEVLVGSFRLYRFGLEEMLAACGITLLGISASQFWDVAKSDRFDLELVVGLAVAAVSGLGIYRRFGFVWAALAGMCCAAAIPSELSRVPAGVQRAVAASIFGAAFLVARSKRLRDGDEWPGDEYGFLQAVAFAGIYAVLNLRLLWDAGVVFRGSVDGWFYWFTWVMTWVLPAGGLAMSIRDKDRPLLVVSLAMAIVTLVTNKPYLGWTRHTWDPMLLGVALIAVALVVRRWLSSGPDGARYGFTARRIVKGKDPMLAVLSAAPFPVQPHTPPAAPPPTAGFDGGRSGGAGAGGSF
jgi:hypothetical protein